MHFHSRQNIRGAASPFHLPTWQVRIGTEPACSWTHASRAHFNDNNSTELLEKFEA
jgi:hypothetical protein